MPKITKWDPNGIMNAALAVTERRMNEAVVLVQADIKRSLNVGGRQRSSVSGKMYSFGSDPGQPPFKQTGRLFNSIFGKVIREGSQVLGVVGTNVVYGRRLELGFVGKDSAGRQYNQAPRPFIRPAFERNRDRIKRILKVP